MRSNRAEEVVRFRGVAGLEPEDRVGGMEGEEAHAQHDDQEQKEDAPNLLPQRSTWFFGFVQRLGSIRQWNRLLVLPRVDQLAKSLVRISIPFDTSGQALVRTVCRDCK